MDRLSLIKRNAVEIITEAELNKLLRKKKPIVYCGYEIYGKVHLGHLATLIKLIDFQKAGLKVKVLFADYHTWLNTKGSFKDIKKQARNWEKSFRKLGLKAEYILGSSFQRKLDYFDDILSMTLTTTINRALRSMQEIARNVENAKVSQILYPFMQIEDIKKLKVDIAYGGLEQRKIHALARELLPKLGYKAPVLIHTGLIPSLNNPNEKMSSSNADTLIAIDDTKAVIKEKIRKAYCPATETKNNPVLAIAKLIIFPKLNKLIVKREAKFGSNLKYNTYSDLEKDYANGKLHPLDLKMAVSEALIEILK